MNDLLLNVKDLNNVIAGIIIKNNGWGAIWISTSKN